MFFDDYESLLRIMVIGLCAYLILVFFLRISGRRTLSKMNAFDFVVTIALGSTLAAVVLNADVALAGGALAFALLIGLQFAVTWWSVRMPWFKRCVTGEPILLLHSGAILPAALKRARVTEDEVRAALRAVGTGDVQTVGALVLETDGSFSVILRQDLGDSSALEDVVRTD